MMQIPVDPKISADQELRITLTEQPMVLRFTWSVHGNCWYIDVRNAVTNEELRGLRLVPEWPLFEDLDALKPVKGDFMLLRLDSRATLPVNYDDLGTRWALCYFTAEEIKAWRVSNGIA